MFGAKEDAEPPRTRDGEWMKRQRAAVEADAKATGRKPQDIAEGVWAEHEEEWNCAAKVSALSLGCWLAAASTVASDIGLGWGATDNPTDKSYSGTAQHGSVTLTFAEAQVVNTVQLFAPSSDMIKMPYDFKVLGFNDGTAWTELLSVTGESNWFAREVRYYTFNNTTAYTQYKLSVVSTVCVRRGCRYRDRNSAYPADAFRACTLWQETHRPWSGQ